MTDTEALRQALDDGARWAVIITEYGEDWEWTEDGEVILDAARRWLALAEGDEVVALRIVETVEGLLSNFPELGIGKNLILGEAFGKVVLAAITEEGE